MTHFPGAPRGSYVNELTIVGDQALSPKEVEQRDRRREWRQRKYQDDPEWRSRKLAAARAWRKVNPDRDRATRRNWMAAYRARALSDERLSAAIRRTRERLDILLAEFDQRNEAA